MSCRVEEIEVKQQQEFANDYMSSYSKVASFFQYSPYDPQSYRERLQELQGRSFPRQEISKAIRAFMEPWGLTQQIEVHLQQLERPDSVVVIGGQQAGLLMGPLYTIHKMISILQLSQQKEAELNVPVVPVFWIAGEDHDFDEINHVFVPHADRFTMEKHTLKGTDTRKKQSVSLLSFPKQQIEEWVQHIFSKLPETRFTKHLAETIEAFIRQSETYVDFFGQLSHHLFKEYGLLFIDSANPALRNMESEIFITILEHYDSIHCAVKNATLSMEGAGYEAQVEVAEYPALLFILQDGERRLLEKISETGFRTKDGLYTYSFEDLVQIAKESPELLSNNVITRPFMQEALFPTLAFIGGPGEISYWALYKEYFHSLGLSVPPLVPRISISLIENPIERLMEKRNITIPDVFAGLERYKSEWLKEQDHLDIDGRFTETKSEFTRIYADLLETLADIPGLAELGPKNLQKILEQVEYLEKRTKASFATKHGAVLSQFDRIELALFPQKKLQERMHNSYLFFNNHGFDVIDQLLKTKLEINGKHKLIYI